MSDKAADADKAAKGVFFPAAAFREVAASVLKLAPPGWRCVIEGTPAKDGFVVHLERKRTPRGKVLKTVLALLRSCKAPKVTIEDETCTATIQVPPIPPPREGVRVGTDESGEVEVGITYPSSGGVAAETVDAVNEVFRAIEEPPAAVPPGEAERRLAPAAAPPPRLSDLEADVIQAAADVGPCGAPSVAERAGYPYDRAFRKCLVELRRRGCLAGGLGEPNYTATAAGLAALAAHRAAPRAQSPPEEGKRQGPPDGPRGKK